MVLLLLNVIDTVLHLNVFRNLFALINCLLSPEKDSFHYSWYLGPAYSSLVDNELLYETVSQYGYLSILLIKYFSVFTKLDLNLSLVILIISFFIIFFALFINLILKTIKYPLLLLVLFACSLIFANVGFSNLSGSMFIPSSSVYRFLPSLLTIFLLSNLNNIYLFELRFNWLDFLNFNI